MEAFRVLIAELAHAMAVRPLDARLDRQIRFPIAWQPTDRSMGDSP
jgi:hypothetical protein